MFTVIRLVRSLLTIYMLLIFFRIIMTWFQGPFMSGPMAFVSKITDPYLFFFRRFRFLRTRRLDFSPLAAIMLLVIAGNILEILSVTGKITVGLVLAVFLSAIWSAIEFFLVFFMVLIVVRLIGMLVGVNSAGPFWLTLDHLLEPFAYRLSTLIVKRRALTAQQGLILTGGVLFIVWLLGGFFVRQLINLIGRLPF